MRVTLCLLAALLSGCALSSEAADPGFYHDMRAPGADLGAAVALVEATPLASGGSPRWVALGDVDQDEGRLVDIVIADGKDDSVRVLRNRGAGQFPMAQRSVHLVDKGPAAVAIGDVDRDGLPDLVVSCAGADAVDVLVNQGAGVFPTARGAATRLAVSPAPGALILADLDGGPGLDLAVVHGEGELVSVLLSGAGGLQAPRSYAVGRFLYHLAALPRGASPPDLLVAVAGTDAVALLRNGGTGAFRREPAQDLPAGPIPVAVYGGDLDGDGDADVAVVNHGGDSVSVILTGAGARSASYPVGRRPVAIAAGDVDGDRLPDLLVANNESDDLTLLRNRGGGTFATEQVQAPIGQRPVSLAIADLDGDGRGDIAVVSQQGGEVTLLRVIR